MKKGTKLKYRGIGFDTAKGDYDMRLKESLFANVIFFQLNPCHQLFKIGKKNLLSGRKTKDG